eukprot:10168447-Prorocentrum_lima.AAC.1
MIIINIIVILIVIRSSTSQCSHDAMMGVCVDNAANMSSGSLSQKEEKENEDKEEEEKEEKEEE